MNKFKRWFYKTFTGIYGLDRLYFVLFGACMVLIFINLFIGTWILYILEAALLIYMVFRFMSKNIAARKRENDWFLGVWRPIKRWFKLQRDRFRDRKTHVYKKCPKCGAILRLPKKKGKNIANCPRCSNKFEVKG